MNYVVTLVSSVEKALDDGALGGVYRVLPDAAEARWLSPGVAVDICFNGAEIDPSIVRGRICALLYGRPIDVIVQPKHFRRKGLLLADMDSTMIDQECIDELAALAKLKEGIATVTSAAMRGEIDFEQSLKMRLKLLQGLPLDLIDKVIKERVSVTSGGRTLVATMKKYGAYTCLVTGGFREFADPIAKIIGFHESRSNVLEPNSERRISDTIAEPFFGSEAKYDVLIELAKRFHLRREETMAVGDGANDIKMIEAAGLGVAYHAKPAVVQVASARIEHSDLTSLLFAQGFHREEFVLG